MSAFSLPTQRCFEILPFLSPRVMLFSAYAEVFPRDSTGLGDQPSFLCLRRGVSALPD